MSIRYVFPLVVSLKEADVSKTQGNSETLFLTHRSIAIGGNQPTKKNCPLVYGHYLRIVNSSPVEMLNCYLAKIKKDFTNVRFKGI